MRRWILLLCLLAAHCNFTSQSYNHGKLLSAGESMFGAGVGRRQFYRIDKELLVVNETVYDTVDTLIRPRIVSSIDTLMDTVQGHWWSLGVNFRLGILQYKPFGNGLEIGVHLEYPAQLSTHYGLPVIEFDARAGFASIEIARALMHHNVVVGWTLGAWVDNGWYAEYAAGLEYKALIPYGNIRALLVATDITTDSLDLFDNQVLAEHELSWNVRLAFGMSVRLPRWPALPDFVSPEVSMFFPNYSSLRRVGLTYHVALRWQNGFL